MPQHVIQRGNNKSSMFGLPSDYRFFRKCLSDACDVHGCRVHAYVFMTNHVHLLVTPSTASGIPAMMQAVGRRYVRRFNDVHGRTGTLWEGRYKATLVQTDQYLLACYRYIELNPVRAGLAATPRDYPWSSCRANAFGARDPLVAPHSRYDALGESPSERRRAYRALLDDGVPNSLLGEIRDATRRGWALGNKRFRDEIATLLARRTQPAIRGRPRRKNDEIRL
jgi:putative transposase